MVMRPPFETSDGTVPVERRRQDGIGLLPAAVTSEQRRQRERSNRLLALFLILTGGFISGGSLTLIEHRMDPVLPLGLILGVVVLGQGVVLAGRRERRGRRRSPEARTPGASPPKGRRRDDRRLSR